MPAPPQDDLPPALPGHRVVRLLGRGACGAVWLAVEESSGRCVAVKCLRAGAAPGARDRLRREAAVLAAVSHPHVLPLRAVLPLPDGFALVLDHAAGGSLADLLAARGRLAPGEVVTMAVPLAGALHDLHGRGVVHGDLAPGNVLWTADGRPLLADLGIARLAGLAAGDQDDAVEGTDGFTDPAVLAGGRPGPAADVHALAALCAYALTGVLPPPGRTAQPPVGAEVPAALTAALRAGLDPDPARRPSAEEFAAALFRCCRAVPVRFATPAAPPGAGSSAAEPSAALSASVALDLSLGFLGGPPPPDGERATRRVRVAPALPAAPVRTAGGRRRSGRRALPAAGTRVVRASLVALAGATALGVAVLAGASWAGSERAGGVLLPALAPAPSAPTPFAPAAAASPGRATPAAAPRTTVGASDAGTSWAAVLDGLYAQRERAFARADAAALSATYAPGSADLAYTRRLVQRLRSDGQRAAGARLRVVSATRRAGPAAQRQGPAAGTPARVVLDVVDRLDAATVRRADGTVASRVPARGPGRARVTLVRGAQGWRIAATSAP